MSNKNMDTLKEVHRKCQKLHNGYCCQVKAHDGHAFNPYDPYHKYGSLKLKCCDNTNHGYITLEIGLDNSQKYKGKNYVAVCLTVTGLDKW